MYNVVSLLLSVLLTVGSSTRLQMTENKSFPVGCANVCNLTRCICPKPVLSATFLKERERENGEINHFKLNLDLLIAFFYLIKVKYHV